MVSRDGWLPVCAALLSEQTVAVCARSVETPPSRTRRKTAWRPERRQRGDIVPGKRVTLRGQEGELGTICVGRGKAWLC